MRRVIAFLLLVGTAAAVPLASGQSVDIFQNAVNEAGQLRMLSQRGAKTYLLFQYHLALRADMAAVAEDFDSIVIKLRAGRPAVGLPSIRGTLVADRLDDVEEGWQVLRKIFTARPIELHRQSDLIPADEWRRDPVLVRYVDRLSGELLDETEKLVQAYIDECSFRDIGPCTSLVSETGRLRMLSEAMTKDVMLAVLNLAEKADLQRLREARDRFDGTLVEVGEVVENLRSPLIGPTFGIVEAYWSQFRVAVDLALDRDEEDIDVDRLLRSQRELLDELDELVTRLTTIS